MCTVMAGIAALGGLMQYQTVRQQTKAQSAYYNAMAEQSRQNAAIADRQRSQIADQYVQRQKALDDKRRLVIGQHNASAGASGLTGGSLLDANSAAYDQWKDSSMNLLWNQRVDTHDAYTNQVNYLNQANSYSASAANARKQGRLAAFSTLLNTASSVYSGLRNYGSAGTKAAGDTSLHHSDSRLSLPETMEDQVFGMNGNSYKSKPLTYGAKNNPYGWLRR